MSDPDEPRASVRLRVALTVAVAAMVTLAACHNTSTSQPPVPPPVAHAFGDTATYGVQVLSLDAEHEVATVSLQAPASLIVLAVVPGREIELILPAETARGTFPKGTATLDMRRFDVSNRPVDANAELQAMQAYGRCMAQAQAQARRMAQARRPVKRDSTGKVIDDGRGPSTEGDDLMRLERSCDRLDVTASNANRKAPPVRLPPRAPADRYLLVLASSEPVSYAQVGERLGTLTAVGSDVATTLEAIASGMYAGMPGRWSGVYVAW